MFTTLMKNILYFLIALLCSPVCLAQISQDIYELDAMDKLITSQVKSVIDTNITGNQTVFLGEAVHYSGSDFLAKTQFVKYLVTQHGYTDIAFESDFFALLFDHNKRNLYAFWSQSQQCKELFDFLEKHNVNIWGFDNQLAFPFTSQNFTKKLKNLLQEDGIVLNSDFEKLVNIIIKNRYETRKKVSKEQLEFLEEYINDLKKNAVITSHSTWIQILNCLESAIRLYTVKDNNSDKKRSAIRDEQMAKNLDFLIKQHPDKKFIVWLANAHMSKTNEQMNHGLTMGYQFRQLNPESSYHIAMSSIRLPPRTEKDILKAAKNDKSILAMLPSLDKNYFVDTKSIVAKDAELKHKIFHDSYIFNLASNKTKLLSHFDALVFIAYGEEVKY